MDEAKANFPHFSKYISKFSVEDMPEFYPELNRSMSSFENANLIYPVGDPIFINIIIKKGEVTKYIIIQPEMTEKEKKKYNAIVARMIDLAGLMPAPKDDSEMEKILTDLLDEVVNIDKPPIFGDKIVVSRKEYDTFKYFLIRDRVGFSVLTPLFYDPWLEDLHCVGVGTMKVIHKIFGMTDTNILFKDDLDLNKYVLESSERVERPTSSRHSVVDAIMPDGSRVNYIYGRDVSLEGSSFTIRKFADDPPSIIQLIAWGTFSCQMAAYLWLCLEHGMNCFVCGETASGKTTSLVGVSAFIKPSAKVYSVENTPEVNIPHDIWQHLCTREAGKASDVTYQDLLIAALRSRPDYILIGEIRGEEGNIAFQAMQTGHPVMSTFHAGSVDSMVQRITGTPINVPIASVDNLNLVLIQSAVERQGKRLRRVLSINEIERYYAPQNKVITRQVFSWDSREDEQVFKGMNNSYILEKKIGTMLGLSDLRDIYKMMALREKILKRMVDLKIFDYTEVFEILKKYFSGGLAALPFTI
jgi:flagellar protein FlaI